ncbi:uncharacterized membrane protein (DUF485 family) [Caldalkalibacillus uzonensis]|uniref:Uncharacterized membrane protein (DUF485 family) n=1 Tax=Caldalkalibacillus uzonensis TaxID=353224 RepID=A0ABU0CNJ9_9BACI|nr:DUF485 domain-containing protein [Caldalkalibacillus uzonensis]MDQ0337987.1 uncharacterized membrane protein (DUF485 family) [Caldalkalibacillus uzonensis]
MIEQKKRWQIGLTLFFFFYFISLPMLTSLAPTVMNITVVGPLTLAWLLALSQFIMIGSVAVVYYCLMKRLEREVDRP